VHVKSIGMRDDPDDAMMERARIENRIVITHDLDFTRLAALTAQTAPSIIIFRQGGHDPDWQIAYLRANLDRLKEPLQEGVACVVAGGRVRLHRLPIGWRARG
jgi:predicted nuclease of predicted toxin-antitoxin system